MKPHTKAPEANVRPAEVKEAHPHDIIQNFPGLSAHIERMSNHGIGSMLDFSAFVTELADILRISEAAALRERCATLEGAAVRAYRLLQEHGGSGKLLEAAGVLARALSPKAEPQPAKEAG